MKTIFIVLFNKTIKKISIFFFVMFLLLFSSCEMEKAIEINSVGWISESIPTSFWSVSFDSATCFHTFWIVYEGDDISLSDIEHVKFEDSTGAWWTLNLKENMIDRDQKVIVCERFWTDIYSGNGSLLTIGSYLFEIELTNGHKTQYELNIPAPGSDSTDEFDYIYTEEYEGPIQGNYISMIERAEITTAIKTTELNITFTMNDNRIYSGWIWLYDGAYEYVGGLNNPFRNYETGTLSPVINGGNNFYTNETINTLSISESDLFFMDGKSFQDIYGICVVLSDGLQYSGTTNGYDCRSVSLRRTFD